MPVSEWLIALYLDVCQAFERGLEMEVERFTNNDHPDFTVQEVDCIYLFGIFKKRFEIKEIYSSIQDPFSAWFPHVPSYDGYLHRLNRLAPFFPSFCHMILPSLPKERQEELIYLLDSMPIVLAKGSRSQKAKVAREVGAEGGHSSIIGGFYGVRLHALAQRQQGSLPVPEVLQVMPANIHDSKGFESFSNTLSSCSVFADKAYFSEKLKKILKVQEVELFTPVKKTRGRKTELFLFEKCFSEQVNKIRQPIESFFNWLQQKTNIQWASKVRSTRGLVVHIFGRISVALLSLIFNS